MSNNDVGEAITMSQPEPGGASEPEVNEKLASLEKLRYKVYELLKALRKVEDAVDTRDCEIALSHIQGKLELLQLYYWLIKVEQKVEGNKVAEEEWGELMKGVREIARSVSKRYSEEEKQLLHVIGVKAKEVEKKIQKAVKKTEAWKKIEEELNTLMREVAGHEEEVLRREGVKG
ncbi:MAG: hypothetical protein N3D79_06540 [Acidilobaceae archaeon]|nr:hypothetical protein [Acidilobaceae archaeon]